MMVKIVRHGEKFSSQGMCVLEIRMKLCHKNSTNYNHIEYLQWIECLRQAVARLQARAEAKVENKW